MTIGLLDLSIVTDRLIRQLQDARTTTRLWREAHATPGIPFDIQFTGLPPDAARRLSGCKVSLYLFHVAPEKFYRNTYPARDTFRAPADVSARDAQYTASRDARRPRLIPQQPLALTLYYLLSAHSESYIEEQQAMSIALKSFHDHPIVTATIPGPVPAVEQELTVTLEPQSIDEVSRVWQALSTSLRLSTVYRASVVFFEPEAEEHTAAPPVRIADVEAYPQDVVARVSVSPTGRVTIQGRGFGTTTQVRFDDRLLATTDANPPPAGSVRVVDDATLELQLARGTTPGAHRLAVRLAPGTPEALFTVDVPGEIR